MRHAPPQKTSQPVPLFQLIAGGHPPGCDDVCAVPAQPSERRGSAIRAWDRHLPRDGEVLVEPVRADVCGRYPTPAGASDARDPSLALAPRRGVCDPQGGVANINGEQHYLWRAVDHEGEVLESYVTRKRDKAAALAFLKKALKRHGRAETIVTDGMRSYQAAMRALGNVDRREMGRWINNRAENSHLPFRRRERAMQRFRQMKSLQKFASVHASLHNHFNQERHITDRQTYKERRSAALAKWQSLAA